MPDMPQKKSRVLVKLFLSTLYLSAFTFGGGYVIVTLLKNKFVDQLHWIEEDEMLDLVAIAQSSPVPLPSMVPSSWDISCAAFPGCWYPWWAPCCRP